jgi:hypothetical protein
VIEHAPIIESASPAAQCQDRGRRTSGHFHYFRMVDRLGANGDANVVEVIFDGVARYPPGNERQSLTDSQQTYL